MRRLVRWTLLAVPIHAVALWLLAWVIPGFDLGSFWTALWLAVALAIVQAIAWPLFYRLAARVHPVVFPILSIALSGLLVMLAARLGEWFGLTGVQVADLWTAILVALLLTVLSTAIGSLFSLNDEGGYDQFVTRALRARYRGAPAVDEPGIVFLEIDGLAEPILERALARGDMPTLRRWRDEGSHQITRWEPDLSSQTSASQAGILLGDNTGIPAFRWWDKEEGALFVSSKMQTAQLLEKRLSSGQGILVGNGGSRWNAFSGDAPDCIGVFSTLTDRDRLKSADYIGYFFTPYLFGRSLSLFLADIARERWQAWRQVRDDVRPRIRRTWKYALVRAATTTWMEEASRFMLASDMMRGLPVVYNTFFAYDEVAHHSGIDREDAFKVLRTLDRVFAYLERIARDAPRPYEFVVLSDHGQSMGATFRQRAGHTLAEVVDGLIDPAQRVSGFLEFEEEIQNLNAAVATALQGDGSTARLMRRLTRANQRQPLSGLASADEQTRAAASDVVVVASGNLGLISFPHWPRRMTYEEIVDAFPRLLPGLVAHPHISFVMARSATEGPIVLGAQGIRYLDGDRVDGVDPLAMFEPNAARHLRRQDTFPNCPDILVMGAYDPETEATAAFEELVGNHGGLGGPQTEPFVFHPDWLDPGPEPIIGAGAVSQLFRRWIEETQPATLAAAKHAEAVRVAAPAEG
ncbi:MAG TPA: phage holin family protein [Thermomicrobiales bacterium]|nr:phage holin family protein [Thermomicrobiales bacterium]